MNRGAPKFKTFIIIFIVIALIATYALFNFRIFISGPQIEIIEPKNGSSFNEPAVIIFGKAKNISYLSIDDTPIFIDESGNFGHKLLLPPGLSIIKLYARDRFEREIIKTLEYVYTGTSTKIDLDKIEPIEIPVATSTEENATSTSL